MNLSTGFQREEAFKYEMVIVLNHLIPTGIEISQFHLNADPQSIIHIQYTHVTQRTAYSSKIMVQ